MNQDFLMGTAAGVSLGAAVFNYFLWQAHRRAQGILFLRLRVAGRWPDR